MTAAGAIPSAPLWPFATAKSARSANGWNVTFADPIRQGTEGVGVNGVLSYTAKGSTGVHAARFLARGATE